MLPVSDTDGPAGRPPGWAGIREIATVAEAEGLDSIWVADHFLFRNDAGESIGMLESSTVLAALAAVTSRVELGPLVQCGTFRSPGIVAKMAATADLVADGRFVLGLGAGWHDPEYEMFGYPIDHRVSRFAEQLEIVVRLLRGERVTFDGRYHQVRDAVLVPPPARRVPVLVAAEGPRMVRLAARWADAWISAWYGPVTDGVRTMLRAVDDAMDEVGRPSDELVRTIGITVRDPDQPPTAEPEEEAIEGPVDDIARALDAYARLGVGQVIVGLEPITPRSVERLASAVQLHRGG